jgi:hypothetical protein
MENEEQLKVKSEDLREEKEMDPEDTGPSTQERSEEEDQITTVCMVTYPCTIKQENSKVLSNL